MLYLLPRIVQDDQWTYSVSGFCAYAANVLSSLFCGKIYVGEPTDDLPGESGRVGLAQPSDDVSENLLSTDDTTFWFLNEAYATVFPEPRIPLSADAQYGFDDLFSACNKLACYTQTIDRLLKDLLLFF